MRTFLPVCVVIALTPRPAQAAVDPVLPIPESERPLTLPSLVLAPEVGFQVDHRPDIDGFVGILDLSARLGITDNVQVDALIAPLQLWSPSGGPQYGETYRNFGPSIGVGYRFLRGPIELAAELHASVFTVPNLSGGSVTPGFDFRVHLAGRVRVDVDPEVTLQFASMKPQVICGVCDPNLNGNAVRVNIPALLLVNATQSFDLGLRTGLTVYDTSQVSSTLGIPLGFQLGYAVPGANGPLLDIDPFFNFPYLLMPGRTSQPVNTDQYQIGINVVGYVYL